MLIQPELLLPSPVLSKARQSGQEYAWRMDDIEEVVSAGANIGLRCLGGQVQFLPPDGTCEAYWLNYESRDPSPTEPWSDAVLRSAQEVIKMFQGVCKSTDFRAEAASFASLRNNMEHEGYNPLDDLWFVLYFEAKPSI